MNVIKVSTFVNLTLTVIGHIVCRICMRQLVARPHIISLLFQPQMVGEKEI